MVNTIKGFVTKFSNDWVMNLAAMLAYNILMSVFPILLALLTIMSYFLHGSAFTSVENSLSGALPANLKGSIDIHTALSTVSNSSLLLTIVTIVSLIWAGSNLFGVMENSFNIIYRARDRDFIPQKVMSIAMVLIFTVLAPIMVAASSLIALIGHGANAPIPAKSAVSQILLQAASLASAFVVGFILFLVIYIVVPNQKLSWRHSWRGAIGAGIGLVIIDQVFPFYTSHFMNQKQYGAALGLFVVVMVWFWFFSIILLLGAEINSYAMGQRATDTDIPGLIHAEVVHQQGKDVPASHQGKTNVPPSQEQRADKLDKKGRGGKKTAQTAQATAVDPGSARSSRFYTPDSPLTPSTSAPGPNPLARAGRGVAGVLGSVSSYIVMVLWMGYRLFKGGRISSVR